MKEKIKIAVYVSGGVVTGITTNILEEDWEYAIVDYDNEPDLPEDYWPWEASDIKTWHLI